MKRLLTLFIATGFFLGFAPFAAAGQGRAKKHHHRHAAHKHGHHRGADAAHSAKPAQPADSNGLKL